MTQRRIGVILAALAVLLSTAPGVAFAGILDADLSITKTDGVATATPGAGVVYTITATNLGPSDVTGASVADTFPAILTCTWTCIASAGSSCTAAGAGDVADSVDLLVNGTATYTATCTVDASATGTLENTATVSSALNDPNPGDNSATDTDTLTPSADLSITMAASPDPAALGEAVTIMVTVSNAGPSDATGVVVTASVPAGLTFDSTTGCAEDPNGVPTCTLGTVPAGQMASYTILATAADGGVHTFEASVASAVADPSGGNDATTEPVAVQASVLEIPTLGAAGVVSLVLLLAGLGLWTMRRRQLA